MKKRRGQMLVEMIVAAGIVGMALTGLVQVVTRSLSLTGAAKNQTEATNLAVIGMEWVKGQRAERWENISTSGTYCLNTLAWTSGVCSLYELGSDNKTNSDKTYMRNLTLSVSGNQVTAVVTVSWQEGRRTPSAKQTTFFYRY